MSKQELIDALEAKVEQAGTVVESAIELVTGFIKAVTDAKDDEQELQSVLDHISDQTERLAAAVATGTAAHDETPPAQTGGEDSGEGTALGNDTITGAEGNDSLDGGLGNDTLGSGAADDET